MTDNEIIEHLRNNKYQKATNGLYNLLSPVKKYVCGNNGTTDDAKDIFQDALVALYRKVQDRNFRLTVSLKTYLLAVVKNLWLQELRRRNKMPFTNEQTEVPDIITEKEKDADLATAAFNLLGERCRKLLIMFYFRKKSYKELASFLGFGDERTAKNQKYRCLEKAKENFITLSTSIHEKQY
jgi:RNA polymerase sigma factor (sigma-70 family)